jgi:hypothetical protein
MKSLSLLNKLIFLAILFIVLIFNSSLAEDEPVNIWEEEVPNETNNTTNIINDTLIENQSLSDDDSKVVIQINEDKIASNKESVIGIFDPEENNFSLDMWSQTDGNDIKKILKRINKLKLSKLPENLLFQVLFTNAYSAKKNLSQKEFLEIKINWLIKKNRIRDLETLLKSNLELGQNSKVIKFLIDEYIASSDIKSACEKINFMDRTVKNTYLKKFQIYCLINNQQKDDAQLIFDLLKEEGFQDKFFEDKINFLLGFTKETSQKILDNNLLNFFISHMTIENFNYEPNDKTDKYIWRYLSSANLIQVNNFEDENIILTYEEAAAQNSFENDEIFKIYLKMNFNFNQLVNSKDIYKSLPNYKARALIYQSILLSDSDEKKIDLAFLLKDLFLKDKIFNIYVDELSTILESINLDNVSEDYAELVKNNLDRKSILKVKFDNDILHRSKVIKHFIDNNEKISRTEKDLKSVYKKIKKNKKYFISIKDIIVFESLAVDGISLPKDLNYNEFSSQLTVPENLQDLANQNQIGLVMLKIVEIIGEDDIGDLDPETLYFLNKILNDLNLKKIRNAILSEALPIKV